MRVLVIGSGGREHALAWRIAREPGVSGVFACPGNPGMAGVATLLPAVSGPEALASLAERERIDLTVIGPELPLSEGVVDVFRARGLPVIGPTKAAAALETSKSFAKAFMSRHGIPTARYRVCDSEAAATAVLENGELGWPVVVKADGLAAGKGVVVAPDRSAALEAVAAMMRDRRFGSAGARVVLEECLQGPELSFFVLSDGVRVLPLGSAQDHKRVADGDQGPNTGGMGAFAPSPLADAGVAARIMREIVEPVIRGMRDEGTPYTGFLYCGLMLTQDGPRVIEFNVRFGDPEAQVVLPLLESGLVGALRAAAAGDLTGARLDASSDRAVGVVLASGGYPGEYDTGLPISGVDEAAALPGVVLFHAGTAMRDGTLVTAGGRVLTVTAIGPDFATARSRAYDAASRIRFERLHMRRDIGLKAMSAASAG
ncbi:MAG TPA: phosphoribosylamine--glycine ligase [Vicinamibacterales bacterium]|nr:phosphoribosylamine--glycine ligase [Vicinamibacterales bacterium]